MLHKIKMPLLRGILIFYINITDLKPSVSMNILHIFNSDGGGGIGGTIEFINQTILQDARLRHFIVIPKGSSEKNVINKFISKENIFIIQIPLHWWNKKTSHSILRNIFIEIYGQLKTFFHFYSVYLLKKIIYKYKIDLIYTTTSCIKSGALAAKLCKKPHLWHIKERIGEFGFLKFYQKDEKLVDFFYKHSSIVLCMSHYVSEPFVKNSDEKKLKIVYDGLDLKIFNKQNLKNARSSFRDKFKLKENELVFGNVGSLGSNVKRHDLFINAAIEICKNFKKIKFIIFGSYPKPSRFFKKDTYENFINFKKEIRKNNLEKKIIFAGHHTNIPSVMSCMDVLVHTCDMEGFGRVIIEAMASSKPVICPDKGGAAEIVIDKKNGLHFKSGRLSDLIDKIDTIIKNKELISSFGKEGLIIVKEKFTINKHAKNVIQLIDDLKK